MEQSVTVHQVMFPENKKKMCSEEQNGVNGGVPKIFIHSFTHAFSYDYQLTGTRQAYFSPRKSSDERDKVSDFVMLTI